MRFLLSLILLSFSLSVGMAQAPVPFASEIARFGELDALTKPPRNPTVFVGSSSIRMWTNLAVDFRAEKVLNRGFGGATWPDVLRHLDATVLRYAPRKVVVYCGGNDINAGRSPSQVVEDFEAFIRLVHEKFPRTKIYLISIAPNPARFSQIKEIRKANAEMAAVCLRKKRVIYIDVFEHMLQSDGTPIPEIFLADRLHMNHRGYAIWKAVVGRAIR